MQVSKLGQQEDDREGEGEGELSPAPSPGPVMSRSVSATPGGQSSSRGGRVRRSLSLRHQERQERAGQQSPASPVVPSSSRTVSR